MIIVTGHGSIEVAVESMQAGAADFVTKPVPAAVLHLRDFYRDDFAAELVAVLPEWIRFLAEHTGMTDDQTERCLAYASGELQFPGLLDERGQPRLMARVTE